MSYPDKDKKVEKQSEKLESPPKKRRKKVLNPLQEMNKEQDSRLPVGKLKWSKEDEASQDTKVNLDLRSKDRDVEQPVTPIKNDDDKEQNAPFTFNDSSYSSDKASWFDPSFENDKKVEDLKISREQKSGLTSTEASLEDTLTPIDFKEYSLEPELKPEEKGFHSYENRSSTFLDDEEQVQEDEELNASGEEYPKGKKMTTWTLILICIPLLLVVVLIAGLIVGHSVIGEQPAGDVFDIEMWEHIYNLIFS